MARCPGDRGRVGVAEQPQPPVGHGPDARPGCRAEGGEGLVPGGPLVRCLAAGFGANRVGGMVVTVHLAIRRDGGSLACPALAGSWVGGHRAERRDGPGRPRLGGVLAEAPGAVVHQGRDFGQVGLPGGGGQLGDAAGPGALRLGEQGIDAVAYAGS